jgi:hypothetical protein
MTAELSMVVHTCNPRTPEGEMGGSWVAGQPGLLSETCFKRPKAGHIAQWYSTWSPEPQKKKERKKPSVTALTIKILIRYVNWYINTFMSLWSITFHTVKSQKENQVNTATLPHVTWVGTDLNKIEPHEWSCWYRLSLTSKNDNVMFCSVSLRPAC